MCVCERESVYSPTNAYYSTKAKLTEGSELRSETRQDKSQRRARIALVCVNDSSLLIYLNWLTQDR